MYPLWLMSRLSSKSKARYFLAGPPLVKAATGEEVTAEDLGGAEVHSKISGVARSSGQNDEHALELARKCIASLNHQKQLQAQLKPLNHLIR